MGCSVWKEPEGTRYIKELALSSRQPASVHRTLLHRIRLRKSWGTPETQYTDGSVESVLQNLQIWSSCALCMAFLLSALKHDWAGCCYIQPSRFGYLLFLAGSCLRQCASCNALGLFAVSIVLQNLRSLRSYTFAGLLRIFFSHWKFPFHSI